MPENWIFYLYLSLIFITYLTDVEAKNYSLS